LAKNKAKIAIIMRIFPTIKKLNLFIKQRLFIDKSRAKIR